MRSTLVRIGLTAAFVVGLACAGEGPMAPGNNNNGNDNNDNNTNTGGSAFAADIQPLFTARCAFSGCHAGANPAQGMDLSAGQAYANIVNVPANETASTSGLMRVRPSFPDSSYLVHKIQGTQQSVGGSGGQMPLTNCCLSQSDIDRIRQWITDGALNN